MKVYLAADHAGFALKERVKHWLKGHGYTPQDEGAFQLEADDDYPDFVHIVARHVAAAPAEDRGIIFGGSGQGEAMVANRYAGVRATVFYGGTEQIIELSRTHNDANVLSFGARFVSEELAIEAVKLWLATDFSRAERHERRIKKIDNLIKAEQEF